MKCCSHRLGACWDHTVKTWGVILVLKSMCLQPHSLRHFYLKIKHSHNICCCSAVQSCLILQAHGLQHARRPCPSLFPRVCSNSCSLSQWCHPTISSSVTPFSSCPQSFPPGVKWYRGEQFGLKSWLQFLLAVTSNWAGCINDEGLSFLIYKTAAVSTAEQQQYL